MSRTRPAPLAWIWTTLLLLLLALPFSSIAALAQDATPVASPVASPASPASPVAVAQAEGILLGDMDLTVDPGDDFYAFANGGWEARSEIPSDSPVYGVADEVIDRVQAQLFGVLEDLDTDPTTPEGKARAIYDQALDTATRDAQGIAPLDAILAETGAIASIEDGLAFQEHADNVQLPGLFVVYSSALPEDASVNVGNLYGPILNLPSEDYYLDESEDGQAIRDAWVDTTTQLLVQLGYSEEEAATAAAAVLAFETELVGIKTPDSQLYADPVAQNNPRTLDELATILPSMDWNAFVQETHLPDTTETLVVVDLPYMEALQGLLDSADPMVLRYLFDTQLIWTYAPYLTTEIGEIAFSFQGPVLLGVQEPRPLEEGALKAVQDWFPDSLSRTYVAEYFPPESKAAVETLVDNLIAAFRIRVEQNPWMSAETKAEALEKLDLMVVKVGYPEEWDTYDEIEIGDSLVQTVLNAYDAFNAEWLGAVDQPVDRTEWFMNAFEVNAYYNPPLNEIVFPAAILQAPYFDAGYDPAVNYGSIGATIGHEITHGFDLNGSQYDGEGNLDLWWTEADFAAFEDLNDEAIAAYSAIEVQPGLMVDGEYTVTENVADMGGLQIAYDGLIIALDAEDEQETPWFLTQQQRFFVAYATSWREEATPEFYEFLVSSDVHAPAPIRAVEPSRHMDEFYDAFDIDPGDPEYRAPEDRVVIW